MPCFMLEWDIFLFHTMWKAWHESSLRPLNQAFMTMSTSNVSNISPWCHNPLYSVEPLHAICITSVKLRETLLLDTWCRSYVEKSWPNKKVTQCLKVILVLAFSLLLTISTGHYFSPAFRALWEPFLARFNTRYLLLTMDYSFFILVEMNACMFANIAWMQ